MRYYDIANDWYKEKYDFSRWKESINSTPTITVGWTKSRVRCTLYIDNISRKYSQRYSLWALEETGWSSFCKIHAGRRDFCWNAKTWPMTATSEYQQIRQVPFPELSPILKNGDIGQCRWIATRHSSSGAREKQYIVWQSHVSYV